MNRFLDALHHHNGRIAPFLTDTDRDFVVRGLIGNSVNGAAEPGEVLEAISRLTGSGAEAWVEVWEQLAERVLAMADDAASAGHTTSAAGAYLRATSYFAVAVNASSAIAELDEPQRLFARQQDAWSGFVANTPMNVEAVAIPFEGGPLPAWFVRPGGVSAASPTLVAVNGSDGSLASLWASCVVPAVERGYNVLLFDGPGQQSQLFQHAVPFRPDWEHVLTPVFDFVTQLPGVSADRIALYGISQGSYWVARALAFEHRFAAAITDPGIVDVSTSWTSQIPKSLLKVLDRGELAKFDSEMGLGMKLSPATARTWKFRARPYGASGYAETITAVRRYTVADVAAQITTPLLILSPENEQFWPGQAAQLAALTSTVSSVVPFTAAEGADGHCQPLARTLTAQRMFDWLDQRVAPRPETGTSR